MKLERDRSLCGARQAIINLQDEKTTSSQDGSQCEHGRKKEPKKCGEIGLFFQLAGVHSPNRLISISALWLSVPLLPSFPLSVVGSRERVKSRAVFSHQTSNASPAPPSDPAPFFFCLFFFFVVPLAEAVLSVPKLSKRAMGKRKCRRGTRRGLQSVQHMVLCKCLPSS